MNRSNLPILIVMLGILLVAGFFTYVVMHKTGDAKDSEATRSLVGKDGEDTKIAYQDLSGESIGLDQYAGKIRIVNSWATWSPLSAEELKNLNTLASELDSSEGVVIAINRSESAAKTKAYLSRLGQLDNIVFVQDQTDAFYDSIEGFAMPETIFYDKTGKIVFRKRGPMQLDEMREKLENIRNISTD